MAGTATGPRPWWSCGLRCCDPSQLDTGPEHALVRVPVAVLGPDTLRFAEAHWSLVTLRGWTDDLRITLPPGITLHAVVETVVVALRQRASYADAAAKLTDLGLLPEDAELACDRVQGGIVRAQVDRHKAPRWGIGRKKGANEPSRSTDPIAHLSYRLCIRDTSGAAWPQTFSA